MPASPQRRPLCQTPSDPAPGPCTNLRDQPARMPAFASVNGAAQAPTVIVANAAGRAMRTPWSHTSYRP